MTDNTQNLPQGLSVPPAATPQVPGAPAGATVVTMPNPAPAPQYQQPAPQAPASHVPPPLPTYPNPMLTTMQPPAPVTAQPAPAPVPVPPPVVPEPPKPTAPVGAVADLAGALGSDPMIAPAIAYLEATATAANLDVQRAFGNAADELDARFIDRAYLVEKVGQAAADQMIKTAEATIKYASQARDTLYSEVRAVAGNDASWNQAVALFNQHAAPADKAALGAMFDSMNKEQMLYAAKQVVQFAQQSGGMVQNVPQPLGAPGITQGLTAEAYRTALQALPRNAPDSQYEALRNQRAVGVKQGI